MHITVSLNGALTRTETYERLSLSRQTGSMGEFLLELISSTWRADRRRAQSPPTLSFSEITETKATMLNSVLLSSSGKEFL
jgi:hypothetical protein